MGGLLAFPGYMSLALEIYEQRKSRENLGYYTNLLGEIVISDLKKAGQHLPTDALYQIGNDIYHINNEGEFQTIDGDCKVEQREDVELVKVCIARILNQEITEPVTTHRDIGPSEHRGLAAG